MKQECKSKKPIESRISKSLKCYFIPHEDNNHRPLIIRPNALKFYSITLILTKLAVTTFLYLAYPSVGFFSSATASNIINLTNSSRQTSNLGTLTTNEALSRAAFQKAQDMIANSYFSHESPSGAKFWNWIQGAGYQYSNAGENLGMDFNSAESVHNALMASTSHRANIMNPNFTEIGVSVVTGKINSQETTILVEMFGTPKAIVATSPEPKPEPEPQVVKEPSTEMVEETTPPQKEVVVKPETTPKPEATPSSPTPAPFYKAEVVSKMENSLGIKTGELINYWVKIKNTGNTTWLNSGENFVALNTTDPAGRASAFYHPSWTEDYRPVKLAVEKVDPSQTAKFEFILKAPQKAGEYKEAFQLVAENLTWIEDSYFEVPIVVTKPAEQNVNIATETNKNINQNSNTNSNSNTNNKKEVNTIAVTNANTPTGGELAQEQSVPFIAQNQEYNNSKSFTNYLVKYYDIISWIIIILIGFALLINTFVKIRIQHADTIIPSLLVILLAATMLILRFHFIENVLGNPIIL